MFSQQDQSFMMRALELAVKSSNSNEVPVGAVITNNGVVIGEGRNKVISNNDVSAHAEILAIRNASETTKNYRLNKCVIYITLEPCHMCAKAILDARIDRLVFSAPEPKTGSIISIDTLYDRLSFNHKIEVEHGLLADESANLLKAFFKARR